MKKNKRIGIIPAASPPAMGMGGMGRQPMMGIPNARPPIRPPVQAPIRRPPVMKTKGMPLAGFAPAGKKARKGKKGKKAQKGFLI